MEVQIPKHRYQDVNKNEVEFRGKIPVDHDYEINKKRCKQLTTERKDKTPLLGMDCLEEIQINN